LTAFYPDLSDERLQTAICVFHQRFSTNTLPKWPLAQPFRFLAHNGEINTITGNRNWAQARRTKFANDLMRPRRTRPAGQPRGFRLLQHGQHARTDGHRRHRPVPWRAHDHSTCMAER
jgi:hypothetical protein